MVWSVGLLPRQRLIIPLVGCNFGELILKSHHALAKASEWQLSRWLSFVAAIKIEFASCEHDLGLTLISGSWPFAVSSVPFACFVCVCVRMCVPTICPGQNFSEQDEIGTAKKCEITSKLLVYSLSLTQDASHQSHQVYGQSLISRFCAPCRASKLSLMRCTFTSHYSPVFIIQQSRCYQRQFSIAFCCGQIGYWARSLFRSYYKWAMRFG